MFGVTLSSLPRKAKWLATLALTSFALNHLFAVALVWQVTTQVDAGAKEHFSYKSLPVLLRMAHQHAFGHGVMYFATGGIFLFADAPDWLAMLLFTMAFVGSWFDIAAWFLLKYRSARWELLSQASGTAYAFAFAVMMIVSLFQMWRPRRIS
ncbi:MAG TPA: hypothetical protein VN915_11165 [Elusimicrobiota bacterium]|nr:hypothetical protein [Elusimicrobiota bacterium]